MAQSVLKRLWPPADPAVIDAGREGEAAVARARVVVLLLLLASPTATLLRDPGDLPALLAIGLDGLFVAASLALVRLTARPEPRPWLGFVTAAADVSFVSLYHAFVFMSGNAAMALGSRVMFALYLLAIAATSLRQDRRIATFAGALAAVQWLALVAWAGAAGLMDTAAASGRFYGDTGIGGQAEEIVMLGVATLLVRMIVARAGALRLSSVRDSLTGLLTRAHFEERLATELIRSARHRRPLALALIDLDYFKQINDTYGHPTGDIVLREVGGRLAAAVRRTDLSARIGGDEFALVLVDTSAAAAAAKLEEIRSAVATRIVPTRDGSGVDITLSAGVAVYPTDGEDTDALVSAADARLLVAKQRGRNCLVVSEAETPAPRRTSGGGSWKL